MNPASAAQAKAKQWRVTRQRGRPWSSPLELAIPRSRCVRLAEYTKTPGMAEESLLHGFAAELDKWLARSRPMLES